MTTEARDRIKAEIARWATPFLMVIVGWFCVDKLADIKRSTDNIPQIQTDVAVMKKQQEFSAAEQGHQGLQVERLASQVSQIDGRVTRLEGASPSWLPRHLRAEPGRP